MVAQTENLPYADQTIDLDPNVRDAWGDLLLLDLVFDLQCRRSA
jgi:hypothetical protein